MNMNNYICYNWMGAVADHCLDLSQEEYSRWGVGRLHNKNLSPRRVCKGDVIFVKTDFIFTGHFQRNILPQIKEPFTLITGASSYQVDRGESIAPILNNHLVRKWYCTNAPKDVSPKIIPFPIGFQERERDGGNQGLLHDLRKSRTRFSDKISKIWLPYHDLSTNVSRCDTINKLKALPFVDSQEERLPFEEYMRKLDLYKYVICLEGSGPDVHRNYESLLMDTVPINSKNIIEQLFTYYDLPGVFLNSWNDLDENYFTKLNKKIFNVERSGVFLDTEFHSNKLKNDRRYT